MHVEPDLLAVSKLAERSATETRYTRDQFMQLPEGFPGQLVEGESAKELSPVWGHQRVTGKLYRVLCDLVDDERVAVAPLDVYLDDYNVFPPDVAVFAAPLRAKQRDVGVPTLVVEVLSAPTARRDRGPKTRRYLKSGVRDIWRVDPDAGTFEVHTAEGARRTFRPDETAASACVPGFAVTGRDLVR